MRSGRINNTVGILDGARNVLQNYFPDGIKRNSVVLKGGILIVKAHPAVKNEIVLKQKEILKKLDETIGKKKIVSIC